MLTYAPLYSGSSGNAAVLASDRARVLVDAGRTGTALTCALNEVGIPPASLNGILITHEHSDHIKGAGILSRKYDLPIYANSATWEAMERSLGNIAARNMRIFETGHDFFIGDINVAPYSIPHDAADPVGYCFYNQGCKIAQMTDLGHASAAVLQEVAGADLLLIESNHDIDMLKAGQRYPYALKQRILGNHGHLSNEAAGVACALLIERGVRRFILGHLSAENNFEELAYRTVVSVLSERGIVLDKDVELYMAKRELVTGIFHVK